MLFTSEMQRDFWENSTFEFYILKRDELPVSHVCFNIKRQNNIRDINDIGGDKNILRKISNLIYTDKEVSFTELYYTCFLAYKAA